MKWCLILQINFFGLLFFSCSTYDQTKVKLYGYPENIVSSKSVVIDFRKFSAYKALYCRIEEINCHDSIPILKFGDKQIEKRINILSMCEPQYSCISRRNILEIIDDKIHIEKIYELDSLSVMIEKHYNNFGKSPYFSESPKRAIISIVCDKISMLNLLNLLNSVTRIYDNLNIETPLLLRLMCK